MFCAQMGNRTELIIVGGGAIGLSVAYHLGMEGRHSVHLFENNQIGSGTSWHAAGIVGPLRSSVNMTRLAMHAVKLFPQLEQETGQSVGYRRTGGYWLAQTQQRLTELARIGAVGTAVGLDTKMISPSELSRAVSFIHTDDLAGALWVAEDAQVSPVDLCSAYAIGARSCGVVIEEHCGVDRLIVENNAVKGVVLVDGRQVFSDKVVLCAGLWSRELAATAGIRVPLQAIEHMYVVTEPMNCLPDPVPIVRDLDSEIYLKGDTGKLVLGGFERNAKPWDPESKIPQTPFLMFDEDWSHFEPVMHAGLNRVPELKNTGVHTFMNGPESFTADTRPMIGESVNVAGLYVAAGFNSLGVMSSAGVGHALAGWIANGHPPYDLWEVDVARADPRWSDPHYLKQRMHEAVNDQFAMHWPLKQPQYGRNLRCTPLHGRFEKKGAVFGSMASWERPLWFAENRQERKLVHTFNEQPWWQYAAREARRMKNSVALIDLTPFTKIELSGVGSLDALQNLCAADMDIGPGRSRYTVMLNDRGGIEADVTVMRLDENLFRIISQAATRYRDLKRIRQLLKDYPSVSIADVTSTESVIGIMGPQSRMLLERVTDEDCSGESFAFGAHRRMTISGVPIVALRRSYVGELGWEIYLDNKFVGEVYEKLMTCGRELGIGHLGVLAIDGCRLEKKFGHWGHDWGPDVTPIEAGIRQMIDMRKSRFLGREALQQQIAAGVNQRLILLELVVESAERPLLLHDEPIVFEDEIIGLTTSGGYGPRTGKLLTFAMIRCNRNESLARILEKTLTIEVAGTEYDARICADAPYDPDGMRMRG